MWLVQGIIGEGYERLLESAAGAPQATDVFSGHEEDYRMADYEDTKHVYNSFGVFQAINPKRRLMERASIAFPLKFGLYPISFFAEEPKQSSRKLLAW